jgi:hypothetical protein
LAKHATGGLREGATVRELLEKIIANPDLEARWLNTLSLLEHMGAGKIMKTVGQTHPTLSVLEHHADESRHAYAFKRLSDQLSANGTADYLCKDEARAYFQTLDHQLAAWLEEHIQPTDCLPNYLLTTSLIERRAMQVYPLYRDVTTQENVKAELKRIIEEEINHRTVIDRAISDLLAAKGFNLDPCWQLEETLFDQFATTVGIALIAA